MKINENTRNDDACRAVALKTQHTDTDTTNGTQEREIINSRRLTEESSQQRRCGNQAHKMAQATHIRLPMSDPLPQCTMLAYVRVSRRCVIYVFGTTPPLVGCFLRTTLNMWGKGSSCTGAFVADPCSCSLRTCFRQQSAGKMSKGLLTRFI